MNWKLIFGLSVFGFAMAFATICVIPSNLETIVWLPVFLLYSYLIGKYPKGKYFLHGFLVSTVNCIWITAIHICRSADYIANHPRDAEMYAKTFRETGLSIHRAMCIMGVAFGVIFGVILGLLAVASAKIISKGK